MKIVFFGSGYYTIPIVGKLQSHGLELVVTTEPAGKFVDFLQENNIPYIYSKLKTAEDIEKVENIHPDIGILASYGAIIPKKIIDIFPQGILNIHPSLLPKYKGPSPIQYTILDGERHTGVSVIKLDSKVDHGPILSQEPYTIGENDTLSHTTELMFMQGAEMINNIIQKMEEGLSVEEKEQSIKGESWTSKIEKSQGEIFLQDPPRGGDLDRMIRAFYPWPGVYLTASLGEKRRVVKLLPNNRYQVEGKNPVNAKEFLNGYGNDAAFVLAKLGR